VGVGKAETRVGRSFPVRDAFCVNIVQLMHRQYDIHYIFRKLEVLLFQYLFHSPAWNNAGESS
jgi:hypothetical protein